MLKPSLIAKYDPAADKEQIRQIGQYLQTQKTQADQDLWNEMMKHLAKMIVKR